MIKEIDFYDYYNLEKLELTNEIDSDGFKFVEKHYSKPKMGKKYRYPNINPTGSRTVNLMIVIGITTIKEPYFDYAYSPRIVRLHLEERKYYVIKKD